MGTSASPRTPLSASPKVTITIPMTCIANISFARSKFHQLSAHAGQGPALQPRDVHLEKPTLAAMVSWSKVLKEPKRDHLALQLRQGRQQAGQGQQVLRLLPGCRRDHQLAE